MIDDWKTIPGRYSLVVISPPGSTI